MSDEDPISIILITTGSRGLKLLFRYPFSDFTVVNKKSQRKVSISDNSTANPYALVKNEISEYLSERTISRKGDMHGFQDSILATMLAPKNIICEQNFELKIEEVKLVGFPVLVTDEKEKESFEECSGNTQEECMIKMVHVVFVLPCTIEPRTISHYQGVSKMIGKGLRHEEKRCRYLSEQREIMVVETFEKEKEHTQEAIRSKSTLAQDLVKIFHSLREKGIIKITLNGWLNLSYCFPRKIHRLAGQRRVFIDGQEFNKLIRYIQPYHTLLLTNENEAENRNFLLDLLPPDASPVINRLVKLSNHNKILINFQTLCQDSDISLPQIFQVVAHLVYWGKCTVIYPLAESNVYVISQASPTEIDCKYAEEFVAAFPNQSLHHYLARFSVPITLGEFRNPLSSTSQQHQQTQIVTWFLKRHMLKQLHTYVLIMPPAIHGQCNAEEYNIDFSTFFDSMSLNRNEKSMFDSFSPEEKRCLCILLTQDQVDKDDITFFLRMSKYFRGDHHLEDIMFYENVSRSKLLTTIDKFRRILITVQHEDTTISKMG